MKTNVLICLFLVLLMPLMISCKGTFKSVKIARDSFKQYKIPEAIYRDEWEMTSCKLYNPNFDYGSREYKSESKDNFRVVFKRWGKGKDLSGKVKKMRVQVYFQIQRFSNDTYEVTETGIEKVMPLKFGRQLSTWLAMIFWGLLLLWSWGVNADQSKGVLVFFQLLWYVYVGFISYHCFMSGWGIPAGILINGFLINFLTRLANNK